jgi:hypothetical protein
MTSNVVRPLSYSRPHQAGTITPTAIVWIVVAFLGTATLNTRTSPKAVIPTIRRANAECTQRPPPHKDGSQQDAEITSPNSFQAVPSNFATRADKKSLR